MMHVSQFILTLKIAFAAASSAGAKAEEKGHATSVRRIYS
jgi:hypothetical protein